MKFIHDDPEFEDLLRIVAGRHGLALGLVEKDYWVTHTLWALHQGGLEVWFKGGTSLSKGFGLITRFSEDLDLKIEPGAAPNVPTVSNWRSEGKQAVAERTAFFEALSAAIEVPGATVTLPPTEPGDPRRDAEFRIEYPGLHLADLAGVLRPYVLLEAGSARVTPHVARDLSSFVHDYLASEGLLIPYLDSRPRGVRCVHPLVTLIEKLDALMKRVPRRDIEPASFVRHYEDAARIIMGEAGLPPLQGYADVRALAAEMEDQRQIKQLPSARHSAFLGHDGDREEEIRAAFSAIAPMFWGDRLDLDVARSEIRRWLNERFPVT